MKLRKEPLRWDATVMSAAMLNANKSNATTPDRIAAHTFNPETDPAWKKFAIKSTSGVEYFTINLRLPTALLDFGSDNGSAQAVVFADSKLGDMFKEMISAEGAIVLETGVLTTSKFKGNMETVNLGGEYYVMENGQPRKQRNGKDMLVRKVTFFLFDFDDFTDACTREKKRVVEDTARYKLKPSEGGEDTVDNVPQ